MEEQHAADERRFTRNVLDHPSIITGQLPKQWRPDLCVHSQPLQLLHEDAEVFLGLQHDLGLPQGQALNTSS